MSPDTKAWLDAVRRDVDRTKVTVTSLGGKAGVNEALLAGLASELESVYKVARAVAAPGEYEMPATIETDADRAYRAGWCACARWAKREDLIADVGSPAYEKDKKEGT